MGKTETKNAGNYIYQYREDGVAVGYLSVLSNLAGQMLVNERMAKVAKYLYHTSMVYDGYIYTGIVFEKIPEDELIKILSAQ